MVGGIKVCQCHRQRVVDKWDRVVVVGIANIFIKPLVAHGRIVLNGYSRLEMERLHRLNEKGIYSFSSGPSQTHVQLPMIPCPSGSHVHAEIQTKRHLICFAKGLFCSQLGRIYRHQSETATSNLSQEGEDGVSAVKPVCLIHSL